MSERLAVGEVEAAYMLGIQDLSEARRVLAGLTPLHLPGGGRRFSIDEIRRRAGGRASDHDISAQEAELIAQAEAMASAPVRRRERGGAVLAAEHGLAEAGLDQQAPAGRSARRLPRG
ncbi:hypothetical protein [Geminicoccus harenae]|uniref:hypothetical protein n=1 Tax=Geminicoccus harenae TaxID=2498453 RepID=UPI00168B8509|nr:hypothetical protein [Geminicoccus harenae]